MVDGAEGVESLDELDELVVASLQPLKAEGASKSRAEGEGRARRVEVEDRGRRRRDGCGGIRREKVCGCGGNQRGEGRAKVGGKGTRCSGGETERAERKTKEGRRRGDATRRCNRHINGVSLM